MKRTGAISIRHLPTKQMNHIPPNTKLAARYVFGQSAVTAMPDETESVKTQREIAFDQSVKFLKDFCNSHKLQILYGHAGDYALFSHVVDHNSQPLHYCKFRMNAETALQNCAFARGIEARVVALCYDSDIIPKYEFDNSIIAFSNGVFFLETGQFVLHHMLPNLLVARRGIDLPFMRQLNTPLFDGLLQDPSPTTYAKIGNAIRGRHITNRVLFLIGGGYDDRRPLRNAIFDTFHPGDTDHVKFADVRRKKTLGPLSKNGKHISHVSFEGFECGVVPDSFLDVVTIANGVDLPARFNQTMCDIVFINAGAWSQNADYQSELPNLIYKCVIYSQKRQASRSGNKRKLSDTSQPSQPSPSQLNVKRTSLTSPATNWSHNL